MKPENVLVARNGYAKLADFGLAKLFEATDTDSTAQVTAAATRLGVVVGTVAYMSPEQAEGRALDARSDIFSFGVVLYESLDAKGQSRIWLARLDRRTAPVALPPAEARGPVFGHDDDVYYRGVAGSLWYIFQLKLDSGEIRKFTEDQAVNSPTITPDGRWVLSWIPATGRDTSTVLKAFPTKGAALRSRFARRVT